MNSAKTIHVSESMEWSERARQSEEKSRNIHIKEIISKKKNKISRRSRNVKAVSIASLYQKIDGFGNQGIHDRA